MATDGQPADGTDPGSPSRIAFVSQRSGMDLVQFPVDGGPPEPLLATSRSESFPDMSASGMLAYVTDADGYPATRLRSGTDTWARAPYHHETNGTRTARIIVGAGTNTSDIWLLEQFEPPSPSWPRWLRW